MDDREEVMRTDEGNVKVADTCNVVWVSFELSQCTVSARKQAAVTCAARVGKTAERDWCTSLTSCNP